MPPVRRVAPRQRTTTLHPPPRGHPAKQRSFHGHQEMHAAFRETRPLRGKDVYPAPQQRRQQQQGQASGEHRQPRSRSNSFPPLRKPESKERPNQVSRKPQDSQLGLATTQTAGEGNERNGRSVTSRNTNLAYTKAKCLAAPCAHQKDNRPLKKGVHLRRDCWLTLTGTEPKPRSARRHSRTKASVAATPNARPSHIPATSNTPVKHAH